MDTSRRAAYRGCQPRAKAVGDAWDSHAQAGDRYDPAQAGTARPGRPSIHERSTMRTLPRLVLITASSLLLGAVPMATTAPFTMNFFGFTSSATSADGTWSSNGSISEVGGFAMSWTLSGGQLAHLNATLVGKQGSITFAGALRYVATSPTDS